MDNCNELSNRLLGSDRWEKDVHQKEVITKLYILEMPPCMIIKGKRGEIKFGVPLLKAATSCQHCRIIGVCPIRYSTD